MDVEYMFVVFDVLGGGGDGPGKHEACSAYISFVLSYVPCNTPKLKITY